LPDNWITVVLPAEPQDLEGCEASGAHQGRIVKQNIVETLIEKNASDGSLQPRLAISWEQVDPSTWTFKLRPGTKFHDGSPFDAKAVKRSLDRTLSTNGGVACSDKSKNFSGLSLEVAPVDELTVRVKTSSPEPTLPMRLTGVAIVGPNTPLDKNVIDPVGTGPYVLDRWVPGQEIVLKRNEGYWGKKPVIAGARYVWRDVSSIRAAMVEISEADIAIPIAEQDARNPKLDYGFLNSETVYLRIDSEKPPLNDVRVRQAINYALDRESLLGPVIPKKAAIATQIVIPSVPGYNPTLKSYPFDPEKAKQLLAKAKADGVPVDREILFVSQPASFPSAGEMMEAFFTMLKNVGLNVKYLAVEPGQYGEFQNKPFKEDRPPIILQNSHDNNKGDPVFSVALKYGCKGNSSSFCDPKVDEEIKRVSSLSGNERTKGWQELFRYFHEDAVPYAMAYHMVGFVRIGPRINFTPDVTTNNEIRLEEISFK
jgi:peptide/nickel transport system substrate-binding protein